MYFLFLSFRMLDDFGHELEMTDSKLQQTVLKVEKVLRLSDGKWKLFLDLGKWVKWVIPEIIIFRKQSLGSTHADWLKIVFL